MQNRNMILKNVLDEVDSLCDSLKLASSTKNDKISALRTIFKNIPILTVSEFIKWLDKYISPRTNRKLGVYGKLRYINALRWYLRNTTIYTRFGAYFLKEFEKKWRPMRMPRSPGKRISLSQFEEILQFADNQLDELGFKLIYITGFRPHELLSLCLHDISILYTLNRNKKSQKLGSLIRDRGRDRDTPTILEMKIDQLSIESDSINEGYDLAGFLIKLSDINPVTPSGRNKTGGRLVVSKDLKLTAELLNMLFKTFNETRHNMSARLFPFKHKYFSVKFSAMKRKYFETFVPDDVTDISSDNLRLRVDEDGRCHQVSEPNKQGSLVEDSTKGTQCSIRIGRGSKGARLRTKPLLKPNERAQVETTKTRLNKIYGFNARLYDLRHSAITNMYAIGLNDQIIRKMVGWRPASKMPNTYVHISKEDLLHAIFSGDDLDYKDDSNNSLLSIMNMFSEQ